MFEANVITNVSRPQTFIPMEIHAEDGRSI